jgi:hypothetical protein
VNKNDPTHPSGLTFLHKNFSHPVLVPSMHPSGVTKENYETSVADVRVDILPQELPHTKEENHSRNDDDK